MTYVINCADCLADAGAEAEKPGRRHVLDEMVPGPTVRGLDGAERCHQHALHEANEARWGVLVRRLVRLKGGAA